MDGEEDTELARLAAEIAANFAAHAPHREILETARGAGLSGYVALPGVHWATAEEQAVLVREAIPRMTESVGRLRVLRSTTGLSAEETNLLVAYERWFEQFAPGEMPG